MQILEELFYGNIRADARFYGKKETFTEAGRLCEKNKERLMAQLSENGKETFENYTCAQGELNDIMQYDKFAYGFKLGIMLMAEVFADANELVSD